MASEEFKILGKIVDIDDVKHITLSDLKEYRISPGYIFYIMANGHRILVLRAGEFLGEDFFKKFETKKTQLRMYKVIDDNFVKDGVNLFNKFFTSDFEEDRQDQRNKLLEWFKKVYWGSEIDGSLLSFIFACEKTFFKLPAAVVEDMQKVSVMLYNRAHIISSLSAFIALSLGYMDKDFLTDIYTTSFLMDYGLIGPDYSYNVSQAADWERMQNTKGVEFLNKNAGPEELKLFLEHPQIGFEKAKEAVKDVMTYPEILSLISLHHENALGTGFPKKLNLGDIAEWESIIIFLNTMISYDSYNFFKSDGNNYFKELLDNVEVVDIDKALPCRRIVMKLNAEMMGEQTKKKKKMVIPGQETSEAA